MSSWELLGAVAIVWVLWAVAAVTGRAVADAGDQAPERKRSGVTIVPVFLFPLVFWQLGRLIDVVAAPWGTLVIGCFHLFLGIVFVVGIARNVQRLREIRRGA
jgi:hypothetical protein